jgi:hypothetical protein
MQYQQINQVYNETDCFLTEYFDLYHQMIDWEVGLCPARVSCPISWLRLQANAQAGAASPCSMFHLNLSTMLAVPQTQKAVLIVIASAGSAHVPAGAVVRIFPEEVRLEEV